MAYQLELLSQLSDVHDVFHVSQLKKYLCVSEEFISGLHPVDQFHRRPLDFHRTSQLTGTASLSLVRTG
jgi:hypothetical protein